MSELASEIEVLVDAAVLGEQVDSFMKSDVGRYLLELAANDQARGYEALKTVDAQDARAVYAAQNMVWRAESIAEWLGSAVSAGLRATMVLESREDDIG